MSEETFLKKSFLDFIIDDTTEARRNSVGRDFLKQNPFWISFQRTGLSQTGRWTGLDLDWTLLDFSVASLAQPQSAAGVAPRPCRSGERGLPTAGVARMPLSSDCPLRLGSILRGLLGSTPAAAGVARTVPLHPLSVALELYRAHTPGAREF